MQIKTSAMDEQRVFCYIIMTLHRGQDERGMAYDYFKSNGGTGNLTNQVDSMRQLYNGSYTLILTIGAVMLVISLLLIFIPMLTGGAKDRAEGKGKLSGTILAGVCMFSLASFMQILITIVLGLSF